MPGEYAPKSIESKWQSYWDANKTFRTPNPGDEGFDPSKKKYYVLDMFPYPSGAGLHVGHPEGYTATDIVARYRRMKGFNVLHTMGWDAFGLPAEQHAIDTGQHPAVTTQKNVDNFRRQLKMLGFSYDWDRELSTTDPDYYRWTQWIFLQLFNSWYDDAAKKARPIKELPIPADVKSRGEKAVREFTDSHRLAYLAEVPVNWCPALGTVLSNEEVTNEGRSERGNFPVYRRPLKQWMLRITKYADRLEEDLTELDWPESVKLMQRNWIGRSEGAQVKFKLADHTDVIEIFTTRPDTLFGATYMVLAPEHPLVEKITTPDQREAVRAYVATAANKSDMDRTAETKKKTGVFTGAYAINPVNEEKIPVWVADYVLMTYGTGAIMAVPGQDQRDWDFAKAFDLPIIRTVQPPPDFDGEAYVDEGPAINSPPKAAARCGTGVPPVCGISEQEHITRRNLPHIQRGGCTYFLTFRTQQGELSADERGVVLGACDYWHEKKMALHAAVVMPDHIHLLLTPYEKSEGEWHSLSEILHSIKSFSAHEIAKLRQSKGAIWLDETFDRLIRDESEFVEKWNYIVENPRTAGIVSDSADYQWTIARQIGLNDVHHRRDAGATAPFASSTCDINGLNIADAKKKITAWLEEKGIGRGTVNYKLRDWLFSRQRYWGEPFPILHGQDGEILALEESELPLTLPPMKDFRPTVEAVETSATQTPNPKPQTLGPSQSPNHQIAKSPNPTVPEPPLGRAKDWVTVQRHGKTFARELNTMPQWAGSCWYYLRFLDPNNNAAFCSKEAEQYWMLSKRKDGKPHVGGIDLYLGGAEHAVLHLLYARFWHKVLFDLGHVSTIEPFGKLFNQGMIRAFAYTDSRDAYIGYDDIDFREDGAHHKSTGEKLKGAVEKMSKSMKNVINPEEVVNEYGGDSLRLYEMFMGPLEASKPWNPRDVPGVFRFLQRAWRLIINDETGEFSQLVAPRDAEPNLALERALHKTIRKVGEDIDRMAFNTGISAMMEFVNEAYRAKTIHPSQAERFTLILAPYAPHIAEELWQRLRGPAWKGSLAYEPWPTWDPAMVEESEVEIPVQVNGKMAGKVIVAKSADEAAVKTAALADEKVKGRVGSGSIVKTIYIPGRMVNLIVK